MTNEVAIKALRNIVEYWTYKPTEVEAAELAIGALEKQIPKKAIRERKERLLFIYCPSCGECISDESPSYCPDCGQAIDWEEGKQP